MYFASRTRCIQRIALFSTMAIVGFGGLMAGSVQSAFAQSIGDLRLEMSNLLELQFGRDFASEEEDRTRFFDQFLLDVYPSDKLRLGLRVERFQDSPPPELFGFPSDEYEYDRLAQRFVEWSSLDATLRVGNGYAILGHGLLFRAFELPGVVRQSLFPIVSYAESRDLDGAVLQYWRGPVELTLLHGSPVVASDVAPEQSRQVRRAGSVSGGRAMVRVVEGVRVGGSVLRADGLQPGVATSMSEEFGAVELEFDPLRVVESHFEAPISLRTSIEYAGRSWQPFQGGLRTETGRPHALYSSTQLSWDNGALGFETKDYHLFRLGVNDPPTLVPEFTHRLLNRTTHVLDPLDEKGHQLTLGQALPRWLGGGSIEGVRATSKSRVEVLGEFRDAREYEQNFVAVESDPRRDVRVRLYFSGGLDESEGLSEIRTVGAFASMSLPRQLAMEVDLGHQVRKRRGLSRTTSSDDFALTASVSRAGLGQVGVLFERTNDPLFLDDPFTDEVEDEIRSFLGGTLAWRVDEQHDVVAFFGERRGGTACTSGTCYFVPDFEGLELRVLSRF